MLNANQEARFWEKVQRGPECWLWTAATDSSGYGRFSVGGRRLDAAHRISFHLAGREIPEGMVVDHICRTRLCVNPDHLRAVSRFENVHENSDAPAHLNAVKTHCPKGHAYSGGNLIVRASGRRRCRKCENASQRARRAAQADDRRPTSIAIAQAGQGVKQND